MLLHLHPLVQAIWPHRDVLRVPPELGLPLEYLAVSRELCLAYCLLERSGLKVRGGVRHEPDRCIVVLDQVGRKRGAFPSWREEGLPLFLPPLFPPSPPPPGGCVIRNAANSTVGQALLQLCKLLRLRAVAVARDVHQSAIQAVQAVHDDVGSADSAAGGGRAEGAAQIGRLCVLRVWGIGGHLLIPGAAAVSSLS